MVRTMADAHATGNHPRMLKESDIREETRGYDIFVRITHGVEMPAGIFRSLPGTGRD